MGEHSHPGSVLLLALVLGTAVATGQPHASSQPATQSATRVPKSTIERPVVVTGKVILPNGQPAAGATVWAGWSRNAYQSGFTEGRADANGRFRLSPPTVALRFLCAGAAVPHVSAIWKRLRPVVGLGPVTLKLPPPTSVSARLVRTSGRPAVGVTVRVQRVMPRVDDGADEWQFSAAVFPGKQFQEVTGRSDAEGRIRLTGLPPGAEITAAIGGDLVPANGLDPTWVSSLTGDNPNGTSVLVEPGEIEVRLVTPEGQPIQGARIDLRRVDASPPSRLADALSQKVFRTLPLDPHHVQYYLETGRDGEIRSGPLTPGRYRLRLRGATAEVLVREGEVAGPVQMVARVGDLRGQVLDEDGKPVADAVVTMFDLRESYTQSVTTGPAGEFALPEFPWAAQKVSLMARHGAAGAEWNGRGEEPWGRTFVMRTKRDHFHTLTGTLANQSGNPLKSSTARLVYLDKVNDSELLRIETDAGGRFNVTGLPRSVPFTIEHEVPGGLLTSGLRTVSPDSARVDLRRVVLATHRPDGALSEPARLLAMPTATELAKARAAATGYLRALVNGDLRTAHSLVSRESPTYAPKLDEWVRRHPLSLPPAVTRLPATAIRPMLALQRSTLQAILGTYPLGELRTVLDEALSRPDWVVLGFGGGKDVNALAVMHRDPEGWKVFGGALTDFVVLSTAPNARALFGAPATAPPAAAFSIATDYFRAWRSGDSARLLTLTHPKAPDWTPTSAAFQKRRAERSDSGKPPTGAVPVLQPEVRLSRWDHSLLFACPALEAADRQGTLPGASVSDPFGPQIRAGGTAVFRYRANGREWLALLVRRNGRWLMLEPAWPA